METYSLKSGVTANYYPIEKSYSIAIGLYIKCGSRYETLTNNGVSHLLEHMHFRRLVDMTNKELYIKTESMGATLMASTYKDCTKYEIKIRPKYLYDVLDLFKKIITVYEWTEQEVMEEKSIVEKEIHEKSQYYDINPYISKLLWKNNSLSYPIIGNEKNLSNFTAEDLINHKKTFYCQDNVNVFITGAITRADIKNINDFFSEVEIPINKNNVKLVSPKLGDRKPDVKLIYDTDNYSDVNISFDIDYRKVNKEELVLLDSIVGGGQGSMLQLKLREEMGLTYNISSFLNIFQDVATFDINYTISNRDMLESIKQVMSLLNKCKLNIESNYLLTNKPFYTENMWYWLEEPLRFNDYLAWEIFIFGAKSFNIDDKILAYNKVSEENIKYIARDIFKCENASILISGVPKRITQKLIKEIVTGILN